MIRKNGEEEKIQKRCVILTFDDGCRTHSVNVLPVLRKYGFHATFFICRFTDSWRKKHEDALMTQDEVHQLFLAGNDIGNHTWNHLGQDKLSQGEIAEEFDRMEQWIREAGCPPSVSYAYPGGNFAPNAVALLKKRGIRCARTTDRGLWTSTSDLMRIPSFPLVNGSGSVFQQALSLADHDSVPVLLYHGIPDRIHPWVNTEAEHFAGQMQYLHENGYEAVSMREYLLRMETSRLEKK